MTVKPVPFCTLTAGCLGLVATHVHFVTSPSSFKCSNGFWHGTARRQCLGRAQFWAIYNTYSPHSSPPHNSLLTHDMILTHVARSRVMLTLILMCSSVLFFCAAPRLACYSSQPRSFPTPHSSHATRLDMNSRLHPRVVFFALLPC